MLARVCTCSAGGLGAAWGRACRSGAKRCSGGMATPVRGVLGLAHSAIAMHDVEGAGAPHAVAELLCRAASAAG